MQLSSQINVILDNGVEIPRLGLGAHQAPPGKSTCESIRCISIAGRQFHT
jgi:hypothetical protein